MPAASLSHVLRHLRVLSKTQATRELSDGELLERFRVRREESAFALLVQRHGPMVLGVCLRILADVHAAEDAFQATFLVLVRNAASIREGASAAGWLHGVARRIALKARLRVARDHALERRSVIMPRDEACDEPTWDELRAIIDKELEHLPEKYRTPLILCGLEGKTNDQAARELGCPKSSLSSRLVRARELLRARLQRRGITVSGAGLLAVLTEKAAAAVPAMLTLATVRAAVWKTSEAITANVAALTAEGIKSVSATKTKAGLALVLMAATVSAFGYQQMAVQESAPDDARAAAIPADEGRRPIADTLGASTKAHAPEEPNVDSPQRAREKVVEKKDAALDQPTPEAAVRSFLDCMNRSDLKEAAAFVANARSENAADWIADMLTQNGWHYTVRDLRMNIQGDIASARVEYQIRGDPGAAARHKHKDGSRIETFQMRRVAGRWKIAPEEEREENAKEYGPIQVYAMMLARDEKAAAQRRSKDLGVKAKLDEYMKATTEAGLFAGSVLVGRENKVLLSEGYGLACIEHSVPNTPKTRFDIASANKTFTAALIMMLREEEKLNLQDPIHKYIDPCPDAWRSITIHHLLSHTSGILNYTELPDHFEMRALASFIPTALSRIRKLPLQFESGERFNYSNTGYKLLHDIIERASGKSFENCLHEKILAPLGMKNTGVLEKPGVRHLIVRDLAEGYTDGVGPLEIAPWVHRSYGGGSGIYSTVEDMHRWGQAFFTDKLLSNRAVDAMKTTVKGNYGCGWFIFDKAKHPFIMHGGNTPGSGVTFAVYPHDKVVIVVASNLDTAPTNRIHDDLAKILFGETVQPPPVWKEIQVDPGIYVDYVGRYQSTSDPKFIITITKENDRLWNRLGDDPGAATMVLRPLSETKYFNKMFVLYEATFIKGPNGKVTGLVADGPWGKQEFKSVK
jgi:RNA polymerase sigma factor (sigma-70 family)